MKQHRIHAWLLKRTGLTDKSLTDIQLGQAWARLGIATAGLLYLWLHGSNFSHYCNILLSVSATYFIYTGITLYIIRRQPLSAFRALVTPLFDIVVISFGMLVDGGQGSGIYLIYLIIIFSNGFRFGNAMMLYTQTLALAGLLAMTAFVWFQAPATSIDLSLLFWQVTTLVVVPAYVYLIMQSAEQAIKARTEAETSSFNLLDKGPTPVFTFAPDDAGQPCILYTNRATDNLFGHARTMLVGKGVDTLILPEDRSEMSRFCLDTLVMETAPEQPAANQIYIRGTDSGGKILKLTCTAIRMHWQRRWIGVCFILDITQRETLHEQLESISRKSYMSTMVAGIVHDFRNVLNNMIGYAELLHMNASDNESRQQLAEIIAAGDRGSALITHLLKLSNKQHAAAQNGKTEGSMLARPLENIVGLSRLQMPQHIQLVCDIEKSLPDVGISIIEIEQVLLNLINNAMQAIKSEGQIRISIGSDQHHRLATAEQAALSIRVSDNGPGIASEDLDQIFKPFWTSRSDKGGSGLGLTMVQRIVKRHHGSIIIDSVANQQTTFSIHIPPICGQEDEPAADTAQACLPSSTQPAIAPCHILLVDDAPDILKVHKSMLSRLGHSSDTAENGLQALALFKKHTGRYDLVITDYRMPVMDGLELTERIRTLDADIPILMITAYGEDGHLQQAGHYGAILVNKPVMLKKLSQGIADAMRASR